LTPPPGDAAVGGQGCVCVVEGGGGGWSRVSWLMCLAVGLGGQGFCSTCGGLGAAQPPRLLHAYVTLGDQVPTAWPGEGRTFAAGCTLSNLWIARLWGASALCLCGACLPLALRSSTHLCLQVLYPGQQAGCIALLSCGLAAPADIGAPAAGCGAPWGHPLSRDQHRARPQ
jgi:hypothetical protein